MLSYHGRLSSASTGKFAAVLFPFALVLSELNMIDSLTGGASTSISSSKSDIVGGYSEVKASLATMKMMWSPTEL